MLNLPYKKLLALIYIIISIFVFSGIYLLLGNENFKTNDGEKFNFVNSVYLSTSVQTLFG